MKTTVQKKSSSIIVAVEGRIDTPTARQLQQQINTLAAETSHLILDCTELEYVSSAGIRVLLAAHKTMSQKNGTFSLTKVSSEVKDILEITGFSEILL